MTFNSVLVLFSCKAGVWKLTDLGFTSEGSSKTLHSELGRGTACYTSPEFATRAEWNNKVDIWALGCIFYEFIYQQRPFKNIYDVFNYSEGNLPPWDVPPMDRRWREATAQVIEETLAIRPQARPTATQLCQTFNRLLLQNPNDLDCPLAYLHNDESSVAAKDIDMEVLDGFDTLSAGEQVAFTNSSVVEEMVDDDESPEPWADRDHGKPPCMQRKECEYCNQTFHGNQGREVDPKWKLAKYSRDTLWRGTFQARGSTFLTRRSVPAATRIVEERSQRK
jgi:serine/threonine protein kinase